MIRVWLILVCGGLCCQHRSELKPATHTIHVLIGQMQFTPARITVARGDTVVWHNNDLVPHTVTADDGHFDSQSIAANGSWQYLAEQAGEARYHCVFHPGMSAALVVR